MDYIYHRTYLALHAVIMCIEMEIKETNQPQPYKLPLTPCVCLSNVCPHKTSLFTPQHSSIPSVMEKIHVHTQRHHMATPSQPVV